MAVSETTDFQLDFVQIIEEAYERCGMEGRGGYDMRTARRSLNLLFLEWANKGFNLWTVEERAEPLTANVGTYTLGSDIVDLTEQMIQMPNTPPPVRYNIQRVSISTQATRTNPTITGRPTEIYIDRQRDAPIVHLWPVPEVDGYALIYWVLRRMYDTGAYGNNADVPFRFLPALISGLAFSLGSKLDETEITEARLMRLAARYQADFAEAASEDREKATLMQVPRGSSYRVSR